ncbi:MBL fold metallo-hydrolase [Flavobacterium sp. NST-5]|uniref:MBL fold metallo-hydrolase n=1 Tax=Flavobacterium ichthyis TaxID=2698827 RepID=A0ABW9Z7C8_9FLAO|nr:MBL fold metallo-hydrolase [Flavobacterium ichthyis]NBL64010.1 MBL fold metallo-hydrolase [Flavobacterium ichthyis]
MTFFLVSLIFIIVGVFLFMNHPKFGASPSAALKLRFSKLDNYKGTQFQNQSFTPSFAEDTNIYKVFYKFFFTKNKRAVPESQIPNLKSNLKSLNDSRDVLAWFGHSSYFMNLSGRTFLVDPVFSNSVSPLPVGSKGFKGTHIFKAEDFPDINYLIITHDHWDHLDFDTLTKMRTKVKNIICPLGVAAHLEHWGFEKHRIFQMNWDDEFTPEENFKITSVPARHFSGRGLKRNGTLWSSYVLQTPNRKLFIGGDSGFDSHFETIGKKFGPFDLAILEAGQYNTDWKYIHMLPEETVLAAKNLNAKKLLPVHWGKFALAFHDWDEPIIRVCEEAKKQNQDLVHPKIGEIIDFDDLKAGEKWWQHI